MTYQKKKCFSKNNKNSEFSNVQFRIEKWNFDTAFSPFYTQNRRCKSIHLLYRNHFFKILERQEKNLTERNIFVWHLLYLEQYWVSIFAVCSVHTHLVILFIAEEHSSFFQILQYLYEWIIPLSFLIFHIL